MSAPTPYPIHLHLQGRLCVVVGGGTVAERKIHALLKAGATVRLVSPDATPELTSLTEAHRLEWRKHPYQTDDLVGATLVFAATNRRDVNAQVVADAQAQKIWVNVADAPDSGDFITPATLNRGVLTLSVSTQGASPALAAHIKQEWEAQYSDTYLDFLILCGELRVEIRQQLPLEARSVANRRIVEAQTELCTLIAQGEYDAARHRARELAGVSV